MKKLCLVLCCFFSVILQAQEFEGPFIDMTYHPDVRTVQLYPYTGGVNDAIRPAVVSLNSKQNLLLEFDILSDEPDELTAKIVYLDQNWLPSNQVEAEYLDTFNEFNLFEYFPSFNGKVDFTHYRFPLPPVKLSGNYLVVIHRTGNTNEVFLTKRFSVYEDLLAITYEPSVFNGTPNGKFQQLNFNVSYENFNLFNPSQDITTVIRKNRRWDKEMKVQPTFYNDGLKTMEYNLLGEKYRFLGGNEYRVFDLRSILSAGMNVANINDSAAINVATLVKDDPRVNTPKFLNDINGSYIIDHYEFGNGETDGDYIYVYFTLNYPQRLDDEVYVFGELTEWKLKKEFRMIYNEEYQIYYCRPLLKQGYYNYEYVVDRGKNALDESHIEGSFNLTENLYEVFIYYTNPGDRNTRLIGYEQITVNPKN